MKPVQFSRQPKLNCVQAADEDLEVNPSQSSTDDHENVVTMYSTYALNTDPIDSDKATEIKMLDFSRPHMRAFHFSWFGHFLSFAMWYAIVPLLPEIMETLGVSKEQIWTSTISSLLGSMVLRCTLGPLCDRYGARIPMCLLLLCSAIPVACLGLVHSVEGLYYLRFFIGFAGGAFVLNMCWCTHMFTKQVCGTANGFAAGWGNVGIGASILVTGSVLFPLFKLGMSTELAWRTVCIVPALISTTFAIVLVIFSDDCPKGNYYSSKAKKSRPHNQTSTIPRQVTGWSGIANCNTWLLFLQYAGCFGVELTVNNAAALYYKNEFNVSTEKAAAIASIFGLMNIFSRGLGGICSDSVYRNFGMRGRLWLQAALLFVEGLLIFSFIHTKILGLSIFILMLFAVSAQMTAGSSFGIAPYISPKASGTVTGIVGAGGNVGAICFGLIFRSMDFYWSFIIMGCCVIMSSFTCSLMYIPPHGSCSHSLSEMAIDLTENFTEQNN